MRYPEQIKKKARELYKKTKSTYYVGHKLGINRGTIYYWVRNLIPESHKCKKIREKANTRAESLFIENGPMTHKESRRHFSEDLLKRLVEDQIIERISRKYGKKTYSIYCLESQRESGKEKLKKIIKHLRNFYKRTRLDLSEKFTYQEKKIAEVLENSNIPFVHSGNLAKVDLYPDFLIPTKENPKIIIEAKSSNSKNRGNYTYFSKIMGYNGFLIKKFYPETILIAIINDTWTPDGLRCLNQIYDHVIFENNISELPKLLNHLSG